MIVVGRHLFDERGLASGNSPGERREWRSLTGVEVQPPLWTARAEWDVTFFFSGATPVLVTAKPTDTLAAVLQFARAGAPAWCVFSPRAQLLLECDTVQDSTPSLAAVRRWRAHRRTGAAWSLLRELRTAAAEETMLRSEELALVEESGRCPREVLEILEAELRRAPRDDAAFAIVTCVYLATNHELASAYAARALPRDSDSLPVTIAQARWLARHGRASEGEELLRAAVARNPEPGLAQRLAAHQLALQHARAHPRRGPTAVRWTLAIAGIVVALAGVGFLGTAGWRAIRRVTLMSRRNTVPALPPNVAAAHQPVRMVGTNPPTAQPHPDALKDLPANGQPVCLLQPRPYYPLDLRAKSVEGQVLVDFVVDDRGIPRNAFVVRSSAPGFDSPAVDAVLHWRFKPGTKDGRRVNTHMQVPIVFALEEAKPGPAQK